LPLDLRGTEANVTKLITANPIATSVALRAPETGHAAQMARRCVAVWTTAETVKAMENAEQ
jgi:hypothetical protein